MKNQLIQKFLLLGGILLLIGCLTEHKPIPELTYSGESPRVQNPLSPEESQRLIQVPDDFTTTLYAAEPDIINPIAFAWDERRRLWVVQSMDYPHGLDNEVGGDRITICEDTDGDGKADKFIDFATEQSLSTGIVVVNGGVMVAQAPDIVFLEDTDGDDKMDKRTVMFSGFGTWDTHAGPANLKYGLDNMFWGSVGYSGFEQDFGGQVVNFTRGVYRFSRTGDYFEPVGQFNNNTWGLGFTSDFEIFGSTANNNHCCYVGIPLRHYEYLNKRPAWAINSDFIQGHYEMSPIDTITPQQVDVRGGFTAAAGANFYTADNYPYEYRNQMYVNEPTGHLVHLARIVKDGAGFQEEDGGNIFASTDAWTAPVYSETGPDGNLWVADWYNPVIQHNPDKRGMPNQIWNDDRGEGNAHLNPLRDKRHGRIYIIKHKYGNRPYFKTLNPNRPKQLISALQSGNMFWRMTAQRLIVEHNLQSLIPELVKLVNNYVPGFYEGALHALWTLDGLEAIKNGNPDAIEAARNALTNKAAPVRKAAIALLPATEKGSQLLVESGLLEDLDLHVRLKAILRASELPETKELFNAMKILAEEKENKYDKWLNAGIKIYFRTQNLEEIAPEAVTMIIPSGEDAPNDWKYTFEAPGESWYDPAFDDSNWGVAPAPFGSIATSKSQFAKTAWQTSDIWLRRIVDLDQELTDPVLKVLYDEDYEIYVNGQPFHQEKGYGNQYKYVRLDPELSNQFKAGKNLIAVHCKNESGRQHIDVGFGKVAQFKADKTLTIQTIPQKMAYDQTTLYAMAGQTLEIAFQNTDEMPHNLVLIEQGSLEAFGKIVDQFLKAPNAAEKEYLPDSRYILGATKMLNPGEKGNIQIKVPDKPGSYPFLCTFPGHWRIMQGVLQVLPPGSYPGLQPDALKIVSMGGGSSHEFLKYFGIADGKILNQNGRHAFHYTENITELFGQLDHADLLLISNNKPFDPPTQKKIFDRINSGMPMLIYHPSTWYNWKDWPDYNRILVGGGSQSHEKLQEFEVEVIKANHPIMKDVPTRFRIIDELYRWNADPEGTPVEVLAIGRGLESGETFPVVWVVKHPNARIVGNTLGHDADAHGLPAYQQILINSLEWAVDGLKEKVLE